MNLLELKEEIDYLIKESDDPSKLSVLINLSQSSIGPSASVGIKYINRGFDWEHNQIRIQPERAICDKSIFENKNKIGRPAYTRESNNGKLLSFCPECFYKISKKDKYCRSCGTKIWQDDQYNK